MLAVYDFKLQSQYGSPYCIFDCVSPVGDSFFASNEPLEVVVSEDSAGIRIQAAGGGGGSIVVDKNVCRLVYRNRRRMF